jgi:hypothetical protein
LRDASREFVVKERKALAEHGAMRLPAHEHGIGAERRLELQKRRAEDDERKRDHHQSRHQREFPSVLAEESRAVARTHPVDDVAGEGKEENLDHGKRAGEQAHQEKPRQHRPRIVAQEREQSRRRNPPVVRRKWIDPLFEEGEQGSHCFNACARRRIPRI